MLCPPTVLYTNVHSRLICNSQNLETAQMSNSFEQVVPMVCTHSGTIRSSAGGRPLWGAEIGAVKETRAGVRAAGLLTPVRLWECCTQYVSKSGRLSSGQRTGRGQYSFQSQRRAMPENVQTAIQLCSFHMLAISHASKIMLRILQARLQQSVNQHLPDVQAAF